MKVLVLGAGIIGTTTAYFLAKDGHEVEVIDRQDQAAMETSFSNAGMVSPGHAYTWASPRAPKILWQSLYRDDTALKFRLRADPALWGWAFKFLRECPAERAALNTANKLRLCLYSQRLFDEINRSEPIAYDRRVGGALYLYRDRAHFDRGVAAMKVLSDGGVRLEPIGPDRVVEIEPALWQEKDNLAGAIHCPTDESGDCHKFANALVDILARDRGVSFHWNTAIDRIVANGSKITHVETSKGAFKADAYVVALGSYAPLLTRKLGLRLPIYPVKGYALTIPIGQRNRAPATPGVDEKYLIAWSRLGDRLRVTAKADFAGYDRSHSASDFAHMLATIKALFPDGADYAKAEQWAGLRPMTPKGTPILGASPLANLFLNSGHGHIGWTMSLGSARIVADVIAGRSAGIDLSGLTLADA
jgi:D-amino-acid dehydrogenase